jgi:hypothetical protein
MILDVECEDRQQEQAGSEQPRLDANLDKTGLMGQLSEIAAEHEPAGGMQIVLLSHSLSVRVWHL